MSLFSAQSHSGNVERLMGQVAERLREYEHGDSSRQRQDALVLASEEGEKVRASLQALAAWRIDTAATVHSSRPVLGPLINRFQRIVRRATWWYVNPIADQIHALGDGVVRALEALRQQQEAMERQLSQMQQGGEYVESRSAGRVDALGSGVTRANGQGVASEDVVAQLNRLQESVALLARRVEALEQAVAKQEAPR